MYAQEKLGGRTLSACNVEKLGMGPENRSVDNTFDVGGLSILCIFDHIEIFMTLCMYIQYA